MTSTNMARRSGPNIINLKFDHDPRNGQVTPAATARYDTGYALSNTEVQASKMNLRFEHNNGSFTNQDDTRVMGINSINRTPSSSIQKPGRIMQPGPSAFNPRPNTSHLEQNIKAQYEQQRQSGNQSRSLFGKNNIFSKTTLYKTERGDTSTLQEDGLAPGGTLTSLTM